MAYVPNIGSVVAFQQNPSSLQAGASIVGLPPFKLGESTNASVITVGGAAGNSSVQVLNFPANQSVSGTVGVSNFPTTQNVSGSVVAFQGGAWTPSVSGDVRIIGSVVTVGGSGGTQYLEGAVQSSVTGNAIMFRESENTSVIGAVSPTTPLPVVGSVSGSVGIVGNPSISGTVLVGGTPNVNTAGSVVAFQGTPEWTVKSSLAGGIFPISGSVAATVTNFPTNQNVSGSVAAWLQSTNASVITVGGAAGNSSVQVLNFPANQSVSGTVGASMIGLSPFRLSDGTDVLDVYEENQADASVTGLAIMWKSNADTSILSAVTQATPLPVSVRGTVSIGNVPQVSVHGNIGVTNFPTNQNVSGSVVAFQGTPEWTVKSSLAGGIFPISGSVSALVTNFPTTQNVSGSVAAFQAGTQITSLVSTVPSSVIIGTSIFGQLPAGTAPLGSVAVLQGTNPWVTNWANSSIIAINAGSVVTISQGSVIVTLQGASIVGTYAEDAAHTTADKGMFVLGVRNDAVSSIASAERDYSPIAVDDVGRNIVVPFAGQQACIISYIGSVVSGSVTLIKASVIGSRSYITDFWVANTGSVAQLVTLQGGDTSVLGYTIAPAGGGSNSPGIAIPLRTTLSQDLAFKVTGTSSVVYMTVKGYQAP